MVRGKRWRTYAEWVQVVCEAWNGEPCPGCGRPMRAYHVDEEGVVWSFCDRCDKDRWTAHEPVPTSFEPEPPSHDGEPDLPF